MKESSNRQPCGYRSLSSLVRVYRLNQQLTARSIHILRFGRIRQKENLSFTCRWSSCQSLRYTLHNRDLIFPFPFQDQRMLEWRKHCWYFVLSTSMDSHCSVCSKVTQRWNLHVSLSPARVWLSGWEKFTSELHEGKKVMLAALSCAVTDIGSRKHVGKVIASAGKAALLKVWTERKCRWSV